ncbi:MAG: hypothetical protein ACTHQ3_11865 [Motilibacteraceae bacterium]
MSGLITDSRSLAAWEIASKVRVQIDRYTWPEMDALEIALRRLRPFQVASAVAGEVCGAAWLAARSLKVAPLPPVVVGDALRAASATAQACVDDGSAGSFAAEMIGLAVACEALAGSVSPAAEWAADTLSAFGAGSDGRPEAVVVVPGRERALVERWLREEGFDCVDVVTPPDLGDGDRWLVQVFVGNLAYAHGGRGLEPDQKRRDASWLVTAPVAADVRWALPLRSGATAWSWMLEGGDVASWSLEVFERDLPSTRPAAPGPSDGLTVGAVAASAARRLDGTDLARETDPVGLNDPDELEDTYGFEDDSWWLPDGVGVREPSLGAVAAAMASSLEGASTAGGRDWTAQGGAMGGTGGCAQGRVHRSAEALLVPAFGVRVAAGMSVWWPTAGTPRPLVVDVNDTESVDVVRMDVQRVVRGDVLALPAGSWFDDAVRTRAEELLRVEHGWSRRDGETATVTLARLREGLLGRVVADGLEQVVVALACAGSPPQHARALCWSALREDFAGPRGRKVLAAVASLLDDGALPTKGRLLNALQAARADADQELRDAIAAELALVDGWDDDIEDGGSVAVAVPGLGAVLVSLATATGHAATGDGGAGPTAEPAGVVRVPPTLLGLPLDATGAPDAHMARATGTITIRVPGATENLATDGGRNGADERWVATQ